jgi:hypothetical protein
MCRGASFDACVPFLQSCHFDFSDACRLTFHYMLDNMHVSVSVHMLYSCLLRSLVLPTYSVKTVVDLLIRQSSSLADVVQPDISEIFEWTDTPMLLLHRGAVTSSYHTPFMYMFVKVSEMFELQINITSLHLVVAIHNVICYVHNGALLSPLPFVRPSLERLHNL